MKSFFAFMFLAALTICAASVTGYSQDIKDYNELYNVKFQNMIRFTFNLNKINPFKLINNIQI